MSRLIFPRALSLVVSSLWLAACSIQPQAPSLDQIARGELQVVDLGYALSEKNPYWPGGAYRPFQFEAIATLEKDGVFSGAFAMPEHLGTHLDAPNHFEKEQLSVDQIELRELVAPIVVVDVRRACDEYPDYRLSRRDLEKWERSHGAIPAGSVVFALTGWGKYWSDYDRYKNQDEKGRMHFPGFSEEAGRFLVERYKVKGMGIDTLSVDYGLSSDFRLCPKKESLRVQVHGRFHSHRLEEYITIEEIKEEALNKARRLLGKLCNHESG